MMTVENIFEDPRYNRACTYIVNCMGTTEVFTDKFEMLQNWGKEEATAYFLNTREVVINVL